MTIRPASKGDQLGKHLTAEFLNKLKRGEPEKVAISTPNESRYDYVLGQIEPTNTSFTAITTYQAALIEGPFIGQSTELRHLISTGSKVHGVSDWTKYRPWGIALDLITQTKAGKILLVGMTWLDISTMTETSTEHTHIDIRDNKLILQNSGPCRILSFKQPHALVVMNNSPPGKIIGLTTTSIAPATLASGVLTPTFADVKIYDWNTAGTSLNYTGKSTQVCNMSLGTVAADAFIQAFFYGRHFVIDWEMCPE